MGMGVGSMRRVCNGTHSSCVIISSLGVTLVGCVLVRLSSPFVGFFGGCVLVRISSPFVGFFVGCVLVRISSRLWVVLVASWKISWRSPSDLRVEVCSCGDLMPSSVSLRCAAAAITRSSRVIDGFVRYLCLKNAAPEMRVARVVGVQNFQHR
jgi:hypothetical protein